MIFLYISPRAPMRARLPESIAAIVPEWNGEDRAILRFEQASNESRPNRRRFSSHALFARDMVGPRARERYGFQISPFAAALYDASRMSARGLRRGSLSTCELRRPDDAGVKLWNLAGTDRARIGDLAALLRRSLEISRLSPGRRTISRRFRASPAC
ncbi:hypothetical protein [Methylosinus sp. C49]|uniref:hypothetical protein n=1 Tax=Methylosinus sp. C49 TaxID=2699395 RepID=UPI00137977C0|nr:hypothetical protein [Methylosinus sp. C49]